MFEKEAENRFQCKKVLYKWETDKRSYIDGFKDGAEFGYNKAKVEVEVEDSYRESLCNSELNLASVTEQLEELKKEKCELLGLIQAKDKLIEKMKLCKNCEFNFSICDTHCQDCDEHYSNWRLAE